MIFSPDQLDRLVAETLPAAPSTGQHAVVGSVDQHGAQVVASFTSDGHRWYFEAAARHDWNGDNSVGAKVLLTW